MCVELHQLSLAQDLLNEEMLLLSDSEQTFAKTLRYPEVKRRYIRVRQGVRQVLGHFLQESAKTIRFAKTDYGKPYLLDYPTVNFNISHTGDSLLIAISLVGAVGVDIEQERQLNTPLLELVRRCFAPEEIAYWQQLPDTLQLAEFYRLWTAKEAFVKAVGRGIGLGLSHCVIAPLATHLVAIPPEYGTTQDWRLINLALTAPLQGALVIATAQLPANFSLKNKLFLTSLNC